jgi:methylmalonyl-CoA mutase N-terminal domain/subunit
VLGGCQSLHTNALDEALALPTEHAARLALRTQQVIAHETGVASTIDPLAGSYYVESLTDELEARACRLIAQIDELGGALAAIEHGFQSQEIHRAAYEWERQVNAMDRIIVGVNAYAEADKARAETLRVDEQIAAQQAERLRELRASRDATAAQQALASLRSAAEGDANLVEPVIAAVEAECTIGEICGVLRELFGEYRPRFGL